MEKRGHDPLYFGEKYGIDPLDLGCHEGALQPDFGGLEGESGSSAHIWNFGGKGAPGGDGKREERNKSHDQNHSIPKKKNGSFTEFFTFTF